MKLAMAAAAVGAASAGRSQRAGPPPSTPQYGMELQEATIALPDGVRLAADLYRPTGAATDARFPVLLEYLPYRKTEARGRNWPLYSYFVQRGYVVARVDIRGTGNSEGTLVPYEYSDIEHDDGEDVIAWLAQSAVVDRRRGHVRHLLGRLQRDPDGGPQPARVEGFHRGGRHRRPVPGGRPLHGRHHASRLLGDEPGPRQRRARGRRIT